MERYKEWLDSEFLSNREKNELVKLSDEDKYEHFYADLKFGTSGIRAKMGMGTNRYNRFVVARATKALADTINEKFSGEKSVVIGYDSRNNSEDFAILCAEIMATNGIFVHIFNEITPTPQISFAITHLKAQAGINITASHNPKEYNGYKVYMDNGAQINSDFAKTVTEKMQKLPMLAKQNIMSFKTAYEIGFVKLIDETNDEAFMSKALELVEPVTCEDFSVVYTPLYGTGHKLIPEILQKVGVENLFLVETQMKADGNFPNMPKGPNPEEITVYKEAIAIAKENKADLIMATDPDADRIGVMVDDGDSGYVMLTGNMIGVLLANYIILKQDKTEKYMIATTIVSSRMAKKICEANDVTYCESFTGFRFLQDEVSKYDEKLLFAFEEAYGYGVGNFIKEKDAITTAGLICEMAMTYKNAGKTLLEALEDLYEEYGIHIEETVSFVFEGSKGTEKMIDIMTEFRENPMTNIYGKKVINVTDYYNGTQNDFETITEIKMKGANVVKFELENDICFMIRPSGTEPKVKVYFMAKGESYDEVFGEINKIKEFLSIYFRNDENV